MKLSSFAAILILAATAASAQEMPADYASVLQTLGNIGAPAIYVAQGHGGIDPQ